MGNGKCCFIKAHSRQSRIDVVHFRPGADTQQRPSIFHIADSQEAIANEHTFDAIMTGVSTPSPRDMIFLMVSTEADFEPLVRVMIPSRTMEAQPYLAFSSLDVGQFFLRARDIDDEKYSVTSIVEATKHLAANSEFLVFRSGQQILDSISDPEGYDYESLI